MRALTDLNQFTIGLVGGMGPWASLDVHTKILQLSEHKVEQDCVAIMHLSNSAKYADRTAFLLGESEVNPADELVKELRVLEKSGVDIAAIVCNTAHAFPIIGKIRSLLLNSSMTYVNIIDETIAALERDGIQKAGLLATLGTYQFGLYQQFDGEMILPCDADKKKVHDCIYHPEYGLKVHYPNHSERIYQELASVGNSLIERGAEALVLGCTELPLLAELKNHFSIPIYDPNQILAVSLMREAKLRAQLFTETQLKQI